MAVDLKSLEQELPPIFARSEVDRLTGGVIQPQTLANLEAQGLGPRKIHIGRKAVYERRAFLEWLARRVKENDDKSLGR